MGEKIIVFTLFPISEPSAATIEELTLICRNYAPSSREYLKEALSNVKNTQTNEFYSLVMEIFMQIEDKDLLEFISDKFPEPATSGLYCSCLNTFEVMRYTHERLFRLDRLAEWEFILAQCLRFSLYKKIGCYAHPMKYISDRYGHLISPEIMRCFISAVFSVSNVVPVRTPQAIGFLSIKKTFVDDFSDIDWKAVLTSEEMVFLLRGMLRGEKIIFGKKTLLAVFETLIENGGTDKYKIPLSLLSETMESVTRMIDTCE